MEHVKTDDFFGFANAHINECTLRHLVWSADANEQEAGKWIAITVTDKKAMVLAARFEGIVKKHVIRTSTQVADVLLMYEMTFKADARRWVFEFGFPGADIPMTVARTEPRCRGTLVIDEACKKSCRFYLKSSL